MPAAARALLFALCALAAPAYLQAAVDPCSTSPTTATTKYTIKVEPADYKENTNYNVTVQGVAEADTFAAVQLQALDTSKNTNLGNWTKASETHYCPDNNLLYNTSSHSFTAHWTSPSTVAEFVEIRAYITEADKIMLVERNLTQASSSTTESTKVTGITKKPANDTSNASHTTHSTEKPPGKSEATAVPTHTTKAGSDSVTYSSCILIAIVQSVYLLFISGKQ